MDNFRIPASKRSLSTSSLSTRQGRPRPRYSIENQDPDDNRRRSFRNRSGATRSSNPTSPGWSEAQARSSRKISDIYKNPQLYTAGVWQNQQSWWNFPRTCVQLAPAAAAIQFCAVSTALLSAPNLVLLGMPLEMASLAFFLSGVLGTFAIFLFRTLVKRFYNHRRKLVVVVCGFLAYLTMGVLLVLLANVRAIYAGTGIPTTWNGGSHTVGNNSTLPGDLDYEKVRFLSTPSSDLVSSEWEEYEVMSPGVEASRNIPLVAKLLALAGFSMVGSAAGSGQYLLQSVAMTSTHSDRRQLVVTIATLASAGGGSLICIIGSVDFSLANNLWRNVLSTVVLMCGANIALLLLGVACFLTAWRLDSRDLRQSFSSYSAAPPKTQRTSRSTQQVFDERAHLLGHHTPKLPRSPYHSRPPKYYDPNQQRFVPKLPNHGGQSNARPVPGSAGGFTPEEYNAHERRIGETPKKSTSSLLDRQETLSTASVRSEETIAFSDSTGPLIAADILKRYNYAAPQGRDNSNTRRRWVHSLFSSPSEVWKMAFVLLLVFCVSSCVQCFEYTATSFLLMGETGSAWAPVHADTTLRKGSFGLLLAYLAFALGLLLSFKFLDLIGWKKLSLGVCLVCSLLTLLLALLRDSPGLFLPAALTHGLLKALVVALPDLLTLHTVRSQGGHQTESRRLLLIEGPTCVLWSLTPLSLGLAGTAAVPLALVTGRVGAPMMYSAISGFLACLGIIATL